MQEVSAVCDTILIIDKGKLVVADTPDNLIMQFGNTGDLALTVRGPEDTVTEALKKIKGINKVEVKDSHEEGAVNLSVFCDENVDVRENIFNTMHDAGTPLLEMQTQHLTLEDIYLMVTRDKRFEQLEKMSEIETEAADVEADQAETATTETKTSDTVKNGEEENTNAGNL
jgi:ABC-2 type transport system ATP-binding protein